MVIFCVKARRQGTTTALLLQLAEDKRPEEEWNRSNRGSHWAPSSLWEQLICQHHYEPLISWPAPVFGGPGFWWAPPPLSHSRLPHHPSPSGVEERPGDPHSWRMIDRAAARRKGSCDEREKERSVYPCPLCAFNHLPSCLPRPCPHNRVLTEAVSRQH